MGFLGIYFLQSHFGMRDILPPLYFQKFYRREIAAQTKQKDQNPAVSGFSNGPKVQLKPFEARENPPMIQSQQIGGSGLVV